MILTDLGSGALSGEAMAEASKNVRDLAGYWKDEAAASLLGSELLYVTQTWACAEEGLEGALLWGNTTLMPGAVGDEYFMTRGHWHLKRNRGEMCITVSGEGALILMDEERRTRMEPMMPGSTHYVPGQTAHRTANTGDEPLVFLCCWPADCGHEYGDIASTGFSSRLMRVGGEPRLVPQR